MPRRRKGDEVNLLRYFRTLAGLTQQEASDKVGVSRTLWSAWEGRTRPITLDQLTLIQRALQLTDENVEELRKWWATRDEDEAEDGAAQGSPEEAPDTTLVFGEEPIPTT